MSWSKRIAKKLFERYVEATRELRGRRVIESFAWTLALLGIALLIFDAVCWLLGGMPIVIVFIPIIWKSVEEDPEFVRFNIQALMWIGLVMLSVGIPVGALEHFLSSKRD